MPERQDEGGGHRCGQGHCPDLRRYQPGGHPQPECFEIEAELERDLDIPVFHDDQHGTAIIVLAGVLNALKVVGKRIEDVKIVQNGPGAAGTAIIHMLQVAGAKNIVAVDEHGILYPNRPAGLEGHKAGWPRRRTPTN